MDNFDLFDGKEVYFHIMNRERTFEYVNKRNPDNAYHILVREWNPESWEFGPLYEIKVDK